MWITPLWRKAVFVASVFMNSQSPGTLSISHLWQNDFLVSSCNLALAFIWLPDVPASSQASPHLQTPRRNMQAQFPRAPCVKRDETRPAPPLPLESLLEDGKDAVLPVLPQSFFPCHLCVELYNTLGVGKPTFLKQWKLKRCISF